MGASASMLKAYTVLHCAFLPKCLSSEVATPVMAFSYRSQQPEEVVLKAANLPIFNNGTGQPTSANLTDRGVSRWRQNAVCIEFTLFFRPPQNVPLQDCEFPCCAEA